MKAFESFVPIVNSYQHDRSYRIPTLEANPPKPIYSFCACSVQSVIRSYSIHNVFKIASAADAHEPGIRRFVMCNTTQVSIVVTHNSWYRKDGKMGESLI